MNYRGTIGFDTLPYINVVHEMIVVVDYNIYIYVYTYMISMIVSFRYDGDYDGDYCFLHDYKHGLNIDKHGY